MSNAIKITVIGGDENGREEVRDLFTSLLVGRSRAADIRLKEADVSGRHFEFVRSAAGCGVKVLSRNGLTVDGKPVGEGAVEPIGAGSILEMGERVRLRVDELPGDLGSMTEGLPAAPAAEDEGASFFESDAADPGTSTVSLAQSTGPRPADGPADGAPPPGDFDEALTEAADGETQEMQTRVGSMEEISARKRQLDSASVRRRWRFVLALAVAALALAGVWYATGTRRHVTDAEGPFRLDGRPDVATTYIRDEAREIDFAVEYPRDDRMKVVVSKDENAIDVVSWLGVDRDVPFHLEFRRWRDPKDLQFSLEDSFERRMAADAVAGVSFETRGGRRPEGEFFETAFPVWCEDKENLRGVRFIRSEFTRSMRHELWHGMYYYFRRGDTIFQFRTEIPEIYWKRGGYRLKREPYFLLYANFAKTQWDSPGATGIVPASVGDDELLTRIKRELSADRVAAWSALERYIDTLLVRSWAEKPTIRKVAFAHYRSLLDHMTRFYNERLLAYRTARENGDDKRMKAIFTDCKEAFGALSRDRRSALVNNPEVWSCRQGR